MGKRQFFYKHTHTHKFFRLPPCVAKSKGFSKGSIIFFGEIKKVQFLPHSEKEKQLLWRGADFRRTSFIPFRAFDFSKKGFNKSKQIVGPIDVYWMSFFICDQNSFFVCGNPSTKFNDYITALILGFLFTFWEIWRNEKIETKTSSRNKEKKMSNKKFRKILW